MPKPDQGIFVLLIVPHLFAYNIVYYIVTHIVELVQDELSLHLNGIVFNQIKFNFRKVKSTYRSLQRYCFVIIYLNNT